MISSLTQQHSVTVPMVYRMQLLMQTIDKVIIFALNLSRHK